jgi:hypothetical protein
MNMITGFQQMALKKGSSIKVEALSGFREGEEFEVTNLETKEKMTVFVSGFGYPYNIMKIRSTEFRGKPFPEN